MAMNQQDLTQLLPDLVDGTVTDAVRVEAEAACRRGKVVDGDVHDDGRGVDQRVRCGLVK